MQVNGTVDRKMEQQIRNRTENREWNNNFEMEQQFLKLNSSQTTKSRE